MRFAAAATAVLAAVLAAGCAGPHRKPNDYEATVDKIIKEVSQMPPSKEKNRTEELLSTLQKQLEQARRTNQRDEEELGKLRTLAASTAPAKMELGFATYGKDWTGDGRTNGVEVHIIVRDATGSAIKCPGSAEATLAEEATIGRGREIDRWVISADTLRNSWNESLFPAYVVQLPWHEGEPKASRAVLTVKFTPVYGQVLTSRKNIEIAKP